MKYVASMHLSNFYNGQIMLVVNILSSILIILFCMAVCMRNVCFFSNSILRCSYECSYPCPYVSLLRAGCLRAKDPEIFVVEEVPDHYSDGILTFQFLVFVQTAVVYCVPDVCFPVPFVKHL